MKQSFKIYDYQIEPETSSVKLLNREFRLEPKVMSVLCLLAQEPGKVFSKAEILEQVWPNQVVDPELVTRSIFELRKLFCDDPKQPKYLKTIPRKGYMLIPDGVHRSVNTSPLKLTVKTTHLVLLLCIFSLIIAGLYVWKGEEQYIDYKEKLSYSRSDSMFDFIQAPTNDFAVFTAGNKQSRHLYKKELNSRQVIQLTTNAGSYNGLAFLNNHLVTIKCEDECQLLQYVDNQWLSLRTFQAQISDFVVSPDNAYLALNIRVNGAQQIVLTKVDNAQNEFEYIGLGINAWNPTFVDDTTLIYITSDEQNKLKLAHYNLKNHQSTFLDSPLTRISALSHISGTQIAIAGKNNKLNGVWLYDLATAKLSLIKTLKPEDSIRDMSAGLDNLILNIQSRRLDIRTKGDTTLSINHPNIDFNGVISNNPQRLYFASNRTGSYELWYADESGSARVSEIEADLIDKVMLSRSGNLIALSMLLKQKKYLVLYAKSDSRLIAQTELPHGSNLIGWSEFEDELFLSNKSGESYDLMSLNLSDQTLKTIALNAGYIATRDDKGLMYYDLNSQSLVQNTRTGQKNELISFRDLQIKSLPSCLKLDKQQLYFCEQRPNKQIVYSINIRDKNRQIISEVPHNVFVTDITESSIVYDQKIHGHSSLYEIELL